VFILFFLFSRLSRFDFLSHETSLHLALSLTRPTLLGPRLPPFFLSVERRIIVPPFPPLTRSSHRIFLFSQCPTTEKRNFFTRSGPPRRASYPSLEHDTVHGLSSGECSFTVFSLTIRSLTDPWLSFFLRYFSLPLGLFFFPSILSVGHSSGKFSISYTLTADIPGTSFPPERVGFFPEGSFSVPLYIFFFWRRSPNASPLMIDVLLTRFGFLPVPLEKEGRGPFFPPIRGQARPFAYWVGRFSKSVDSPMQARVLKSILAVLPLGSPFVASEYSFPKRPFFSGSFPPP